MKFRALLSMTALTLLTAVPAMAQTTAPATVNATTETQRDVNQQERIEQGLKSGALTPREAARLERRESRVDKMEAKAEKDGTLTDAEKARIQAVQNADSKAIDKQKHDAQTANPNSASDKRMQADVARDINQEKRIEQGEANGSLTSKEAAGLQKGEAKLDTAQAKAAARSGISPHEQRRLQRQQNRESRRIHKQKTDAQNNPT